ncbi:hypothetical protein Ddye_030215 [Dipteronia dyeriana]|uniref:FRIGIDA-like protein n=1 Tax=Dipteronia dyeriana TaxID=168575 RepID=A0AAD9TH01_9ROSI|nr:hypothetical protein Ddye_030215 [Dipteronia dyeriana]
MLINVATPRCSRKEQPALRSVIKCIEEYKLEAEFPPENIKKRLEQLEKAKVEKKKPTVVPANKRTRAINGGPMPPAKASRSTNAYLSSFPAPPTFVRSPPHSQYPAGVSPYQSPPYQSPPTVYGSRSPQAHLLRLLTGSSPSSPCWIVSRCSHELSCIWWL